MQCRKLAQNVLRYEQLTGEEQRKLYQRYIMEYPLRNSEMSFNSIFIWKDNWPLWVAEDEGRLFLKRVYTRRTPCYWPVLCADSRLEGALCHLLNDAAEEGWPFEMRGVTEEYKEKMEKALPGVFTFAYDRGFSDYIYRTEDLMELKGKKYHGKRNHVNRFIAEHPNYMLREITEADLPRCQEILVDSILSADQSERVEEEIALMRRTMAMAAAGHMEFVVLDVDGVVQGYSAGEVQLGDTALIHLEVANREVQGAYPIINRDFLRTHFSHTTWVNREEDVGMEGLRRAKLSYHPDHLLNKYTAYLKNGARADERFDAN